MADGMTGGVIQHGPVYAETRGGRAHGWVVALAGFGINLALGVLYSWSVIAKSLTAEWGWTRGAGDLPLLRGGRDVRARHRVRREARRTGSGRRLVATTGGALVGVGMMVSSLAGPETRPPADARLRRADRRGHRDRASSRRSPRRRSGSPRRVAVSSPGIVVAGFGIASVYIAPLTEALIRGVRDRAHLPGARASRSSSRRSRSRSS